MRDKLKNQDYFNELIKKEKSNIAMFENVVKRAMVEKGEFDRGTRNGYNILINSFQKIINLLYSSGEDLNTIQEIYKKLLYYYSKMWDRKYGYIELIKVLSLAVLLEIDKDEVSELETRLISENFDDYLVNVLLGKIDTSWIKSGTKFEYPEVYDCLKVIIENKETDVCEFLKEYLQEKWYDIHKECAWYDSHKSSKNIYCGYWSFEAGAIAKILKIDDVGLKNMNYYPYDLVHYKR